MHGPRVDRIAVLDMEGEFFGFASTPATRFGLLTYPAFWSLIVGGAFFTRTPTSLEATTSFGS